MKAAEVMTKDVVTINSSATVAKASQLMSQKGVRALIVDRFSEADAYGIITETDIIRKVIALGLNPLQIKVADVMTKPCIVVNPDLAVEYVAGLFARAGICRAPVIKDQLLGMISVTDLLTQGNFKVQLQAKNANFLLKQLELDEETSANLEALPARVYEAWCSG